MARDALEERLDLLERRARSRLGCSGCRSAPAASRRSPRRPSRRGRGGPRSRAAPGSRARPRRRPGAGRRRTTATRRRPRRRARAAPRQPPAGCRTTRCRARSALPAARTDAHSAPRSARVRRVRVAVGAREHRVSGLDDFGQRFERRLVRRQHRHVGAEVVARSDWIDGDPPDALRELDRHGVDVIGGPWLLWRSGARWLRAGGRARGDWLGRGGALAVVGAGGRVVAGRGPRRALRRAGGVRRALRRAPDANCPDLVPPLGRKYGQFAWGAPSAAPQRPPGRPALQTPTAPTPGRRAARGPRPGTRAAVGARVGVVVHEHADHARQRARDGNLTSAEQAARDRARAGARRRPGTRHRDRR